MKYPTGGALTENDVFKYILSIGYELETHDIAKLSLSDDGTTLINTDLSPRVLKLIDTFPVDDNHITVPIGESGSYNDYLYEPVLIDGEVDEQIKIEITNDIMETDFNEMIAQYNDEYLDVDKNELLEYKTNDGTTYNVEFSRILAEDDSNGEPEPKFSNAQFTGTEWIFTYYNPQHTKNIIIETFNDACDRLVKHLKSLVQISGNLHYRITQDKVGHIPNRKLFHLNGTSLYYIQTHDSDDIPSNPETYDIEDILIIPQMTIRMNAVHLYKVMRGILDIQVNESDAVIVKTRKNGLIKHIVELETISKCVEGMLTDYNRENGKWKINPDSTVGKKITNYLVLIFYKVSRYINSYAKSDMTALGNYFKNYLSFASRHSNFEIYSRVKELIAEHFVSKMKKMTDEEKKGKTVEILHRLLDNPTRLGETIYSNHKKALTTKLDIDSKDYGDLEVSYMSYFYFFENPIIPEDADDKEEDEVNDWLKYSKIDVYSTQFPLEDDNVLVENRSFFSEFISIMDKYGLKYDYKAKTLHISDLDKFSENSGSRIINPNTGKLSKRCNPGYRKNEGFRCVRATRNIKARSIRKKGSVKRTRRRKN